MGKCSYSEYVKHCLRYYVKFRDKTVSKSKADSLNWLAVDKVFQELSARDKEIVLTVYDRKENMRELVEDLAIQYRVDEYVIWGVITGVERKVAIARGLI